MKELTIVTSLKAFAKEELTEEFSKLYQMALEETGKAYAPYSHFRVGAAALLENGEIIKGSNQENAAYPSGLCAERVALFYAGAKYPDVPVKLLAIAARDSKGKEVERITPCGACRQVLLETEQRYGRPMTVLLGGRSEVWLFEGAASLLPACFGADDLK